MYELGHARMNESQHAKMNRALCFFKYLKISVNYNFPEKYILAERTCSLILIMCKNEAFLMKKT